MKKLYLLNSLYENEKNRIVLYFADNILSSKFDFTYKEKFNPYFYVDIPLDLGKKLLYEFKGDIKVELIEPNIIKVKARNYEILQKSSKIISLSTGKNIILLEPERQYLLNNNWSYYDTFCITHENKIKKIKDTNDLHIAIKNVIENLDNTEKIRLSTILTKKLITCNLLSIKPNTELPNEQILNMLFENNFYKKALVIKNKPIISIPKRKEILNKSYCLDFSGVIPHLLLKENYNIGFETINCTCCKPNQIFEANTLSNSLVEVRFEKNGFYFISTNKQFRYKYHQEDERKENRLIYMHENKIRDLPSGPFFSGEKQLIPLSDAIRLTETGDVTITHENNKLSWYCLKNESFISEIISRLIKRLKIIEKSISISNYSNYSKKISNELDNNFSYTLYMTEYALLLNLLSEIPIFMAHTNTKFYTPEVTSAIKTIKEDLIVRASPSPEDVPRFTEVTEKENICTTNKNFVLDINTYFTKINLPIPRLVVS